jgi:hypothetical protein
MSNPFDHAKEAAAARAHYRAHNPMPPGTQVQHWTKVLLAKEAGMSTAAMNRNLSPLQSRNNMKATTMLTDPNGGGTRYSVKGGSTYGNEHKFADRHMIPTEHERIKAANPNVDPKVAAEAAGAVAKWKMTGDPGNVSKQIATKVDIGKGEKFRPNPPGGGGSPRPAPKPGGSPKQPATAVGTRAAPSRSAGPSRSGPGANPGSGPRAAGAVGPRSAAPASAGGAMTAKVAAPPMSSPGPHAVSGGF